jgi:hypothetical protein
MRTAVLASISSSLLIGAPSSGMSPEASYLEQQMQKPWQAFQKSETFGLGGLVEELANLAAECSVPGWDGQGASPVAADTIDETARVLHSLPLGVARPTIGVEPDGHITLEWYSAPRQVLSVSVSPEAELHYSALLGSSRRFGTEPFLGQLPSSILELVGMVMR